VHWIINAYGVLIGALNGSGLAGIPGRNCKNTVKIKKKTSGTV
jgi:hypothetical protein